MESAKNWSSSRSTAPMDNTSTTPTDALLAAHLARPVNQPLSASPAPLLDSQPILKASVLLSAETELLLELSHVILEASHRLDACHAGSSQDTPVLASHLFAGQMLLPLPHLHLIVLQLIMLPMLQLLPLVPLPSPKSAMQTSTPTTSSSLFRPVRLSPLPTQLRCRLSSRPHSPQDPDRLSTVPKGTHLI